MHNAKSTHGAFGRFVSTVLVWTLVIGQVLLPVQAATTPLADVPIAAKVSAKPNIVYTLDDSGSMQYNFLPDYVVNAGATIAVTITRAGFVATASGAVNALAVGDFVNIVGAVQPEYDGYVQIVTKPTATTFTYALATNTAATPATISPGYPTIQVVTSSAYCRAGSTTTPCVQQPLNIASGGTAVAITSLTRPAPISTGGSVTATATGTAANFAQLSTGDSILIENSPAVPIPATTSAPYYGVYTITKTSTTTFTYTITAVSNVTPLASAAGKLFVIQGGSTFAAPPLHAADFNRLAYNPEVTYTAPLKADGLPLTNSGTDAAGNYGATSLQYGTQSVDRDPFSAYETAAGVTPMWPATTKDDLSIKIAVPLYCNTDWPLLVNDANYPGGPNGATVQDAGNSNGQYAVGAGGWCRINGTQYDLSAASGAPAANADYNYPWQSSSGATGAQYFYRALGTKTLWCDKNSPYWPRSGVIIGCQGGTFNAATTAPQSCYQTSTSMACTGSYPALTYKDTATGSTFCDNSATWCSPPGVGTAPECLSCTCVPNTPTKVAACHLSSSGTGGSGASCGCTGVGCSLSACPAFTVTAASCTGGTPIYQNTPAASANCTSFLWDPVTGTNQAVTLLTDAGAPGTSGAPGTTCRHNNYTYATGGAAGLFKYSATAPAYPGEGAGTGLFNTSTTGSCPTVGTTVPIPRHYYVIDSVQFCDNRIVTADVQWKGFGTGVCQTNNDLARYKEVKFGQFKRVDLFATNSVPFPGTTTLPASATPFPQGRVWLATTSPGPDNSESINYANWYAYYSTRLLAAKTTSSIAFSYLTPGLGDPIAYRVGFHNLGEEPAGYGGAGTPIIWVNVNDWDIAQRTAWYNALFGIAVTTYKTPTIDAMLRIGNLFETGGNAGLPAAVNKLPVTVTDPIPLDAAGNKISCQNNFHVLFTDGKTNQVSLPTTAGDQDATIPSGANSLTTIPTIPPDQVLPTLGAGGNWPAPFRQGSPAISDTLADVATRYWAYDLRPTLKNDVPASSGKGTGDLDWTKDVAWWQHVQFSAISFGAQGTLDATNTLATVTAIQAGTLSWPNLTTPNNPIYPRGAGAGAVAVDDLWHATVNSRGTFVYANTPVEVARGLSTILAGIQNQRKSRAAASFGGQVLDATNNLIYESTIEPGWAGDLLKVEIDPVTGIEIKTWWQASVTLKAQILPAFVGDEPWLDPTKRRIVTINSASNAAVPFQFANLSSAQLASLATTATQQQKIIAYLRGGTTFGGATIEGTGIGQFRVRSGALGDISNAQSAIVGPPSRPYSDITDPSYSTYVTANATRATQIVAAANDGMVHVFDAGPVTSPVTAGGGNEIYAFMPKALFRGTAGAAATEDTTAIQALTYQDGGVPIYKHHMYVDSSPRVGDVDFGNGTGNWHTIVVGGLGKGGNSYYALDASSASAADETLAASKVLWEWTDPSGDLKYTYGRPVITKTRAYGWVVIVTSGYNNVSGVGKLYFLKASDGTLLKTMSTGVGTAGNPSGLAQIHAFVKDFRNQIAEQVYGGDLLGNMWRFNVFDPNPANWTVDLFAQVKDLDNNLPQPITTAPQIEIDLNNGIDRYVFFGTGRLLDTSDFTTPSPPQRQTMYAIRDGSLATPLTVGLPIQPRATLQAINVDKVSAIAGGAPNGWFDDLPLAPTPERIVVDVQADVNIAVYIGTQAQPDPCVISLPATLYARDFTTAKSLLLSGGSIVPGITMAGGAVGATIVGRIDPTTGAQSLGVLISGEIPGTKPYDIQNPVSGPGSRLSWRLLTGE